MRWSDGLVPGIWGWENIGSEYRDVRLEYHDVGLEYQECGDGG